MSVSVAEPTCSLYHPFWKIHVQVINEASSLFIWLSPICIGFESFVFKD